MEAESASRPAGPNLSGGRGDAVRSGAELVGLSEYFYRVVFVGLVVFVSFAGLAALALLPLRRSASGVGFGTPTVLATGLLVLAVPFVVRWPGPFYRLLRRRPVAELAVVLLAAALVSYPLRSELWWPACALVMLVAALVGLRRALAYCLLVLVLNLLAHTVAGDLDDTPAVAIIGLWAGIPFWSAAAAVITEQVVAHLLSLNATELRRGPLPRRVVSQAEHEVPRTDAGAVPDVPDRPAGGVPAVRDAPRASPADAASPAPDLAAGGGEVIHRLTARQLQVVALLADGLRYADVAACLSISTRQVERHVKHAVDRLDAGNVYGLVALAVSQGIVAPPPGGASSLPAV